ncbi:hypothetical protein CBR_g3724 [Chara braunii]|uniref:Uncharacterized protein n=1 Tax=Chara braunii TaxID=69332 RepID=A0A388JKC5_CHABU|nr:hypothetical protein CBR_g77333 [Chara braunii]GBG69026.1 hypothetical protein CBR_g3724 [Chara braunii]|eukprot:GBG43756.1 hypothetical protein CBR_g77333 [Chara braunii]
METMEVIKQVWDSGRFPYFFEMIGFSDLVKLARAWDSNREGFQAEIERLGTDLERLKVDYTQECIVLSKREARVEQIFLKAWGLSDSHLLDLIPAVPTPPLARPPTQQPGGPHPTQAADSPAFAFNDDEIAEMQQAIAAISSLVHQPPPRRVSISRAARMSLSSRQFTAFVPLASTHWVWHTSIGYKHCVWKMDTYNHLAPISLRAFQFLAGLTDEQVRKCRARAYTAQMNYCGKSVSPFAPCELLFPLMSYLDPEKCGQSTPVMWHKAIKPPPALDLRNLRKIWSVDRPYLKCSCKQEDGGKDCPGGPLWMDHAFWFLLAHSDVLFLTMSSIKVKTSMLVHFMRTTWKEAVIGCITFIFVRELMMDYMAALEQEEVLTAETVIKDERLWRHQLPPTLGRLLLPTRIPARPRKVTPLSRARNTPAQIPGQARLNFSAVNRAGGNVAAEARAQPAAQGAVPAGQQQQQQQEPPPVQRAQEEPQRADADMRPIAAAGSRNSQELDQEPDTAPTRGMLGPIHTS